MAKKTLGRQKIDIVKIDNSLNLQVAFSKRRAGIFKKASEICTLCGVEVAIVVFSPGQKVFCFGHPSVEEITNRYLSGFDNANFFEYMETYRNENIRDLNMQLNELNNQIAVAKKRGEALDRMRKESQMVNNLDRPIDVLSFSQLLELGSGLAELKNKVALQVQAEKILTDQNVNAVQFLMGSSSSSQGVVPYDENMVVNANRMHDEYAAPNVNSKAHGFGV